tara:strand:+ start:196 stop:477 length:282 start_codon:yes stop_codon:yes gene_type:complete
VAVTQVLVVLLVEPTQVLADKEAQVVAVEVTKIMVEQVEQEIEEQTVDQTTEVVDTTPIDLVRMEQVDMVAVLPQANTLPVTMVVDILNLSRY